MKVFVAGATGVAGRQAVRQLVAAGHAVSAVARTVEKAALVADLGARPVTVDLFDVSAVQAAVFGHEVVVNLATHIPPVSEAALPAAWKENDLIRREVSRNLVDESLAAGVVRYIQESIAFAYEDRRDAWIDENAPVDLVLPTESMTVAESHAARMTDAGATGVVLRFGQFYAPDAPHTIAWAEAARHGVSPFPGGADEYVPTIHSQDIGSAVVAALDAPAGVYNVADDDPPTKQVLADLLARCVGRTHLNALPPAEFIVRLGFSRAIYLRSNRASNRRFKEATGWAPQFRTAHGGLPLVMREITSTWTAT